MEDELRGRLRAQLSGLLDFDFSSIEQPAAVSHETRSPEEADQPHREEVKAAAAAATAAVAQKPEELTFQFRLFRDEKPTHTVVIQPQGEQVGGTGEVGFVVPKRPMSYYVAEEPDHAAAERFRASAVTADYLLQDAKRRRWGLEKPWRVTSITITAAARPPGLSRRKSDAGGATSNTTTTTTTEDKRKRPGKKRRILLRTRDRAKREAEETAKKQLVDKEEHLKEKKKRLNREKKLKRRAKEKEKKTATKETDE